MLPHTKFGREVKLFGRKDAGALPLGIGPALTPRNAFAPLVVVPNLVAVGQTVLERRGPKNFGRLGLAPWDRGHGWLWRSTLLSHVPNLVAITQTMCVSRSPKMVRTLGLGAHSPGMGTHLYITVPYSIILGQTLQTLLFEIHWKNLNPRVPPFKLSETDADQSATYDLRVPIFTFPRKKWYLPNSHPVCFTPLRFPWNIVTALGFKNTRMMYLPESTDVTDMSIRLDTISTLTDGRVCHNIVLCMLTRDKKCVDSKFYRSIRDLRVLTFLPRNCAISSPAFPPKLFSTSFPSWLPDTWNLWYHATM